LFPASPESYANEMGEQRKKSRATNKFVAFGGAIKSKSPLFAGFLNNLPSVWPNW
jgi:hypothetical protein